MFSAVWDKLSELTDAGLIVSPSDVLLELEKQKDDLYEWAKQSPGLFLEPDREVMEVFTEIVNTYPDFMKVNSTKSGADPFVVALAKVKGLVVVTYETAAKKNAAPKIPNVCLDHGLDCVQLVDVLRTAGFKM